MDHKTLTRVWLPLFAGLLALTLIFRSGPGPHDTWRLIGLLLGLIGLTGVIVSRYTLGQAFSIRPRATQLVTAGIYSRIRNPIYVSGLIFLTGFLLMVRSPHLWILLPIIAILQFIRARQEGRVLEAKFGDAYRQHRARTWF